MTIDVLDSSFQAACEAASLDNSGGSESYAPFSASYSIIDTGASENAADLRLVIDGIEYCQVTDENDASCNN